MQKVIREFCLENSIDIDNIEVHKNHYGLRYTKEGKKGYQRFRVLPKGKIEWVGEIADAIKSA